MDQLNDRVQWLTVIVGQLKEQLAAALHELTQFGADNAHQQTWLTKLQAEVKESVQTTRELVVCVQGFAQRLAALEIRFQDHVEGKADDRSEGPHDPRPGGDSDRNGRGPAHPG